jgi:hypothetical protein
MGSGRKIEHYGEITIRCTNGVSCTINFPKVAFQSFNFSSMLDIFISKLFFVKLIQVKLFFAKERVLRGRHLRQCGEAEDIRPVARRSSLQHGQHGQDHLANGYVKFYQ